MIMLMINSSKITAVLCI